MSAALGQPVDRRLTDTRDYLRAEFGYGTATEIADLFRALAVTCVQRQVRRVLIVAGDDDPAGERALRDALKMMLLAGISPVYDVSHGRSVEPSERLPAGPP